MNSLETETGCRISVFPASPDKDHSIVRFTMIDPQDGRFAEVMLTEAERLQFIQALVR